MTTLRLSWLPHLQAYAVRLGARMLGCVAFGYGNPPFRPDVRVEFV